MKMLAHHKEIFDRFVAACNEDDRIVAAFLGGSYANGMADQYSDLDLYFVIRSLLSENYLCIGWESHYFWMGLG